MCWLVSMFFNVVFVFYVDVLCVDGMLILVWLVFIFKVVMVVYKMGVWIINLIYVLEEWG